jgi:hypothetical protein
MFLGPNMVNENASGLFQSPRTEDIKKALYVLLDLQGKPVKWGPV